MTKILLVEDNPLNQDMLSRRLKRQSYEVVIAVDGAAALSMAKTEEPDVILMDMNIPIIDGWEATRRLKADVQTQKIPVIALTAYAMKGDREKAIAAGCDDYATKPVEFKPLLKTLRAFAPPPTNTPSVSPQSLVATSVTAPVPTVTPEATSHPVSVASNRTPSNGAISSAIPATPATPAPSAQSVPPSVDELPFTLLVVNDNVTNREILSAHLQRRGYTVVKVDSPSTTLDVLNQFSIDLVLLDIMVPDSGNFNLLQQIRKTHDKTDLSVILITVNDSDEDVVKAFDAGANDYVSKPINLAIVMARIKSQLETLQANRQLRLNLHSAATAPSAVTTEPATTTSRAFNDPSTQASQPLLPLPPLPDNERMPVLEAPANQTPVNQTSVDQTSVNQTPATLSNSTRTSKTQASHTQASHTQSISTFVSSYKPYFLGHIFAQTPFSKVRLASRPSELEADSDNLLCFVETFSLNNLDDADLNKLRKLLALERSRLESISQNDRILSLLDYFENDETFGWYQNYAEGRLFSEELSAGQIFSAQKVLKTIKELLEILLPFHTRKIVHGSIQPQHLWRCSEDNALRLLNLGLSRRLLGSLRDQSAGEPSAIYHPAFNHEHDYMPTEQRIGRAIPSSDLYAVGLIALQMLTGKQPSVLTNHLIARESSLEQLALVPAEIQPLLTKMVAQDHQARYPSALSALKGFNELMSSPR